VPPAVHQHFQARRVDHRHLVDGVRGPHADVLAVAGRVDLGVPPPLARLLCGRRCYRPVPSQLIAIWHDLPTHP
jgi:hypothetical protein